MVSPEGACCLSPPPSAAALEADVPVAVHMQARHRGRAGAGRHAAGCCEAARQPSTGTQAPHKPQNEINEQLCGDPWAVRLRRPGWHNDMYVLACTSLGAWPAGQRKVTSGTALTSGRSPSLGRASAKGPARSIPPARPKTLCARAHAPLARPRGDAGAWVERARGHWEVPGGGRREPSAAGMGSARRQYTRPHPMSSQTRPCPMSALPRRILLCAHGAMPTR